MSLAETIKKAYITGDMDLLLQSVEEFEYSHRNYSGLHLVRNNIVKLFETKYQARYHLGADDTWGSGRYVKKE